MPAMSSVNQKFLKQKSVGVIPVPFSGGQASIGDSSIPPLPKKYIKWDINLPQPPPFPRLTPVNSKPRDGVDRGPLKMIEFGLLDQLQELDWKVKFDGHRDYTQLRPASDPPVGKLLNARYVSAVTESVAKSVAAHLKEGSLALTLGGDHSIALGTVAGTMSVHPDAALIWIDAHAVGEIFLCLCHPMESTKKMFARFI